MSKKSRISLTLPESTKQLIAQLAKKYGVSASQLMQTLIERGLTIEALAGNGGELIFKTPDDREILVVSSYGHLVGFNQLLENILGESKK